MSTSTRAVDARRISSLASPPIDARLVLFASVFAISWSAPLVRFTAAPALTISFWRVAFALVLIGFLLAVRGEWRELGRLSAREWAIAALAGVFLAGHFASWIASLSLTSIAASVTLVATGPIWVAIFAALALGERPGRWQWAGILITVLGAAWIGWGDAQAGPAPLQGDLLALLGAIFVAGYYVIGRGLRRNISLWPYVAVVYGFAAITLLLLLLATGTPVISGYETRDWAVFVALAVGPMMIGHTGQNWALRYLPAFAVNLSLLGEPIGATLIAWLLPAIGEPPPLQALGGGVLILTGLVLGLTRKRGHVE